MDYSSIDIIRLICIQISNFDFPDCTKSLIDFAKTNKKIYKIVFSFEFIWKYLMDKHYSLIYTFIGEKHLLIKKYIENRKTNDLFCKSLKLIFGFYKPIDIYLIRLNFESFRRYIESSLIKNNIINLVLFKLNGKTMISYAELYMENLKLEENSKIELKIKWNVSFINRKLVFPFKTKINQDLDDLEDVITNLSDFFIVLKSDYEYLYSQDSCNLNFRRNVVDLNKYIF